MDEDSPPPHRCRFIPAAMGSGASSTVRLESSVRHSEGVGTRLTRDLSFDASSSLRGTRRRTGWREGARERGLQSGWRGLRGSASDEDGCAPRCRSDLTGRRRACAREGGLGIRASSCGVRAGGTDERGGWRASHACATRRPHAARSGNVVAGPGVTGGRPLRGRSRGRTGRADVGSRAGGPRQSYSRLSPERTAPAALGSFCAA